LECTVKLEEIRVNSEGVLTALADMKGESKTRLPRLIRTHSIDFAGCGIGLGQDSGAGHLAPVLVSFLHMFCSNPSRTCSHCDVGSQAAAGGEALSYIPNSLREDCAWMPEA
jgi:hypothetical protein